MKNLIIIVLFVIVFSFGLSFAGGKINLNKATVEELMTLPYVGENTVKEILEYREKHKGFKSVDELKAIKGIGKKKYETLKNMVTVESDEDKTPDTK